MADSAPRGPIRRTRRGWRRPRTLIGVSVVAAGLIAGGAVWAAGATTNSGYRMTTVVRASVNKSLTVVGTVEPVRNASAAFQVGGQVATLTATVGQTVTAGQSLATLSTAALSESVSSAQSAVNADEAKLTEDESAQTAAATNTTPTTTPHTTTTTSPTNTPAISAATISQDQNTLTADEATTSVDQQQEAADLAAAQTACATGSGTTPPSSTTTTIPPDPTACSAALQTVSDDEHRVSTDQNKVSQDEGTLAQDLGQSSSSSPTGTGSAPTGSAPTGSAPTGTGGGQTSHALSAAAISPTSNSPSASGNSPSNTSNSNNSAASDTPQQIATDQADIDSAKATLIDAQQSLNEAQLTSPINGTIVSIGMAVGDTVSAGSSTAVIVIIGTQSFEVSGTLSSSQVAGLKVGDSADVAVDGLTGVAHGTISQVGPVQASDTGYTYPVVVALPSSVKGLFAGSTANVTIATGQVSNVVAVPTSAVQTQGSTSYVEMLKGGTLTRKTIKTGMVGADYTEVRSGLTVGESVVLADLSLAVPSSNTATLGGFGGGGFGGFGGGGFGGRGGLQINVSPTGGAGSVPVKSGG